jgi:nitrate reductase gamma subunit
MDEMLEFARGPLFALTLGIMVLGLGRLILIQAYTLARGKGRRLRDAPWRKIIGETVTWAIPLPHLIRGTIVFSSASFTLHIGLIVVPLLLADHIALWERSLGVSLPSIGRGLADVLTVVTLFCLLVLLGSRIFTRRLRAVSSTMDYLLLVVIFVPFASGFMASHPGFNPLSWRAAMLVHVLSAELLFVLVPCTKLAHVVLYAFDRISAVHWQLRPGAGERVARALFGEEARV